MTLPSEIPALIASLEALGNATCVPRDLCDLISEAFGLQQQDIKWGNGRTAYKQWDGGRWCSPICPWHSLDDCRWVAKRLGLEGVKVPLHPLKATIVLLKAIHK